MGRVKSALLLDFDNIYGALAKAGNGDEAAFVGQIANWMQWFEDGAFAPGNRLRRFLARRVYWNTPFQRFRPQFEAAGFETFTCAAIAKLKIDAGKSSADIVMTMDALELPGTLRGLEEMILLTTDSDFVPVVNRLRLRNLRVVAAGNERNPTHALYSKHADVAIHLGALRSALTYTRAPRKWYMLHAPPPVIPPIEQEAGRNSSFISRVRTDLKPVKAAARASKAASDVKDAPPESQRKPDRPEDLAGLHEAARRLEDIGRPLADQSIGKQKIMQMLHTIDGFAVRPGSGKKPWFGYKNYKRLMKRLAEINPNIEVTFGPDKTVIVVYRTPAARVEAAQAEAPAAAPPAFPSPAET